MARRIKEERQADKFIMWKSVLMAGIVLGVLFSLAHLFLPRFLDETHRWHPRVLLGLKVLALWLVVSSAIRALNQLSARMPGWQLALGGFLTALAGALLNEGILNAVRLFQGASAQVSFDYRGLIFFTGAGLLLSIVTMINLRVRSRFLGNVLEFLVIIAFLAILFYVFKY
jgi:hypothetical protein